MPAQKISLEKAKQDKLFYFVANVVVCRESDGRCLILKRDEREAVHPGKYGVIGGKLEWADLPVGNPTRVNGDVLDFQDALERLLVREAKEEAGIEIGSRLAYVNSVAYVRPDGVPVIMLKFAAAYAGGEVVLEKGAFTDHAWADAEEVKDYPCIEGIPEEVAEAIRLIRPAV